MRKAMYEAEVGDDVYGEDPTVKRLEEMAAAMLGKEAALYVTSGTQGNLVSLLTHCTRGDGVIAGKNAHILNYEGGGLSVLGGMFPFPVDDEGGIPAVKSLDAALLPADNVHFVRAKLLCLEDTHNKEGGNALTKDEIAERVTWAHQHHLAVHVDGARLFNAAVALKTPASELVRNVDSVQICLSKGLGAPVGSLICASQEFIDRARFWRKKVGGGLRQVGVIAAAGVYALEHNVERLAQDHENAALMGKLLHEGGLSVQQVKRPTNMLYFKVADEHAADRLWERCRQKQVFFNKSGSDTFRLVTHLDVSHEQAVRAAEIILEESKA